MANDMQNAQADKPMFTEDPATIENKYCESPAPMPVSDCGNCMTWYVRNLLTKQAYITVNGTTAVVEKLPVYIEFEVTYEFTLCLTGRRPGKLLYTTSLLPQEEVKIYVSDRYRRSNSASASFSVHSSFRSSVSALQESLQSGSTSNYSDILKKNNDSSGASASFLGLFGGSESQSNSTSNQSIQSIQSASQNFQQIFTAASSSVEAQRSLVVSSYEDQENLTVTSRTLKNYNNCHAVTYYVRQVNESYEFSAKIASIRWRIFESRIPNTITDWQTIDDVANVQNADLRHFIETTINDIESSNQEVKTERCFSLPTDGTMLETELAYCSSCDDERMMELELNLEMKKVEIKKLLFEAELLRLEVKEKKKNSNDDND